MSIEDLQLSDSDAAWIATQRELLPTNLGTEEIRDQIPAAVRARAVFTARGTSAIFLSELKEVVEQLANGDLDDASARLTLLATLKALGYTPEGGFPDDPPGTVPPAIAGSLQDLSSFRRLDLIVQTQRELMAGAGQQFEGHAPDRLESSPAWELVRYVPRMAPRNWRARWQIAGGTLADGGRMIAFKGDPVWGELGSSQNFSDALDVDYPPFAFSSGMGCRAISRAECKLLGITGPEGESIEEWVASQPATLRGKLPLPTPSLSLTDVDPAIRQEFQDSTGASDHAGKPGVVDYSDLLEEGLNDFAADYQKRNPTHRPTR